MLVFTWSSSLTNFLNSSTVCDNCCGSCPSFRPLDPGFVPAEGAAEMDVGPWTVPVIPVANGAALPPSPIVCGANVVVVVPPRPNAVAAVVVTVAAAGVVNEVPPNPPKPVAVVVVAAAAGAVPKLRGADNVVAAGVVPNPANPPVAGAKDVAAVKPPPNPRFVAWVVVDAGVVPKPNPPVVFAAVAAAAAVGAPKFSAGVAADVVAAPIGVKVDPKEGFVFGAELAAGVPKENPVFADVAVGAANPIAGWGCCGCARAVVVCGFPNAKGVAVPVGLFCVPNPVNAPVVAAATGVAVVAEVGFPKEKDIMGRRRIDFSAFNQRELSQFSSTSNASDFFQLPTSTLFISSSSLSGANAIQRDSILSTSPISKHQQHQHFWPVSEVLIPSQSLWPF